MPEPAGRAVAPQPRLFALAWPLLAELLLGFGVALAGLWLASRSGDASAAAFGLASQVLSAFFLTFRVVSVGASVVLSQLWGAGQPARARESALAAFGASTWAGLVLAALLVAVAPVLLRAMQAPADVVAAGTPYLRWLALPLLLDAMLVTLAAVLRAGLHARDTLWVSLAIHGLHLLLTPLAMQHFGLPGFAMAMAASRVLGVVACVLLWKARLDFSLRQRNAWWPRLELLKPMLHIGVPGAGEGLFYRLAVLLALVVVARLGTQALATHSYAMQITNLLVLYALAIGFALEILIGRHVGAGELRRADALMRRSLKLALAGAFAVAVAAALAGPWLLRAFTQDEAVVRAGAQLLWLHVLLELGRTLNVVVINALRGTGDARFPVVVGVFSMLGVMAGGAWFFGAVLGWGLLGVWLALALDEALRGSIMWWRWRSRAWVAHARAARRRARATSG